MTVDLTKITTPFGLLDKETQEALDAHGGPYELFCGNDWRERASIEVSSFVYRVKPEPQAVPAPLTKPSIDWSHVADEG